MLVLLVSVVVYFVSFLLTMALSRYRELAADRSGALLIGRPSLLASALVKITGEMGSIPTKDLRAAEPFNAFFFTPAVASGAAQGEGGGFSFGNLFRTHPTLEKRLAQLDSLERQLGQAGWLGRPSEQPGGPVRHHPRPLQAGPGQPRRAVRPPHGRADPAERRRAGDLRPRRGLLEAAAGPGRGRRPEGDRRARRRRVRPGRRLLRLRLAPARRPGPRRAGDEDPHGQLDAAGQRLGAPAAVLGVRLRARAPTRPTTPGPSGSSTSSSAAPSTPSLPSMRRRSAGTPSSSCASGPWWEPTCRWKPTSAGGSLCGTCRWPDGRLCSCHLEFAPVSGATAPACRLPAEERLEPQPRRRTDVAETLDRMIALEGAVNFRDLGGYEAGGMQTRWRTLFRADGLGELTEADLSVLRALGIRTVIDLRSGSELERGRFDVDAHPVAFHHFPFIDELPDAAGLRPPPGPAGHAVPRDRARRRRGRSWRRWTSWPRPTPSPPSSTARPARTAPASSLRWCSPCWAWTSRPWWPTTRSAAPPCCGCGPSSSPSIPRVGRRSRTSTRSSPPTRCRWSSCSTTLREQYGSVAAYVDGLGAEPGLVGSLRAALLEPAA